MMSLRCSAQGHVPGCPAMRPRTRSTGYWAEVQSGVPKDDGQSVIVRESQVKEILMCYSSMRVAVHCFLLHKQSYHEEHIVSPARRSGGGLPTAEPTVALC